MNKINIGEIVFCNLIVEENKVVYNKKTTIYHTFNEVVYKHIDGYYYNYKKFNKLKINKSLKVTNLDIISRLGYENKNVKELRNK